MTRAERAAAACPLCAAGYGHHTNSATSIGGDDRHTIWDIHQVEDTGGVGLRECLAYDIWTEEATL